MNKIIIGDCREVMRRLIVDGVKVQACVTSPPYWGLRDYGHDGQLGLEKTPEEYVDNMVEVFRLVRDLLSDDGTLWLNIGDSYASGGRGGGMAGEKGEKQRSNEGALLSAKKPPPGLKDKDLVGIPWMVAFALRADGWYLRSDIIWHKPNPMPESVTDRPTKSHEYIFLMSKNKKYYYDSWAINEIAVWDLDGNGTDARKARQKDGLKSNPSEKKNGIRFGGNKYGDNSDPKFATKSGNIYESKGYRNKRSVWTVATKPYSEAHFATFPPDLIEPCILAGAPIGGVVIDPFFGSGTTGEVAEKLGRKWIGIELNPEYEKLQKQRTSQTGMTI